jgi:hypothetical protein
MRLESLFECGLVGYKWYKVLAFFLKIRAQEFTILLMYIFHVVIDAVSFLICETYFLTFHIIFVNYFSIHN